jgi:hypothetical protein
MHQSTTAVVVEEELRLDEAVDLDVLSNDPVQALLPVLRALPGWKRVRAAARGWTCHWHVGGRRAHRAEPESPPQADESNTTVEQLSGAMTNLVYRSVTQRDGRVRPFRGTAARLHLGCSAAPARTAPQCRSPITGRRPPPQAAAPLACLQEHAALVRVYGSQSDLFDRAGEIATFRRAQPAAQLAATAARRPTRPPGPSASAEPGSRPAASAPNEPLPPLSPPSLRRAVSSAGVGPQLLALFGNGRVEEFLHEYDTLCSADMHQPEVLAGIARAMASFHHEMVGGRRRCRGCLPGPRAQGCLPGLLARAACQGQGQGQGQALARRPPGAAAAQSRPPRAHPTSHIPRTLTLNHKPGPCTPPPPPAIVPPTPSTPLQTQSSALAGSLDHSEPQQVWPRLRQWLASALELWPEGGALRARLLALGPKVGPYQVQRTVQRLGGWRWQWRWLSPGVAWTGPDEAAGVVLVEGLEARTAPAPLSRPPPPHTHTHTLDP